MGEPQTRHWVLLRGLSRDARHWGDFIPQLQRQFPQDHITCLDLPGCGEHWQVSSPTNITAMVANLRRQLQAQTVVAGRPARPITLLALSMGAMVAAAWQDEFPAEVQASILVNSSSSLSAVWQRIKLRPLAALLLACCAGVRAREQAVLYWVCNTASARAALEKKWCAWQRQKPVGFRTIASQLWAAARYRPKAGQGEHARLLLCSRGDRLVDYRCSHQLALHWRASVVEHSSAGHDLPIDDAPWLLNEVTEWLADSAPNAASLAEPAYP